MRIADVKKGLQVSTWHPELLIETLRDKFAMAALQGMISSAPMCDRTEVDKKAWAKIAYAWADAMIVARRVK